jgi:hypothetical protein
VAAQRLMFASPVPGKNGVETSEEEELVKAARARKRRSVKLNIYHVLTGEGFRVNKVRSRDTTP